MALRDQPYLPLYIQDFMTDEKLIECSAESTGVYIRIMCLMHKSSEYGKILLKQKYKQTDKQTKNFAKQLARSMPYDLDTIEHSLDELLTEEVLFLEESKLVQKRMVRDNYISEVRKSAGNKGVETKKSFAKAKVEANTESEYESEDENENEDINYNLKYNEHFESFRKSYPGTKRGLETELSNFKKKHKDWKEVIPLLPGIIEKQIRHREKLKRLGKFVPEWKNLQTWINQRCWEEEIKEVNQKPEFQQ